MRADHSATVRNVENLMLLDREFHRRIALATRNGALAELLLGLHEQSLRFWFILLSASQWHEIVQREHLAILDALRKRDPQEAENSMRRHIESIRGHLTQLM
jgi:DNA-binding FadR family transcriptional regulator